MINRRLFLASLVASIAGASPGVSATYMEFARSLLANPPNGGKFRPDLEARIEALTNGYRKSEGKKALKARKAELVVADIVEMPALPSDMFELVVAMGDPLSICSDARRACREMARITRPGGMVIATADNTLAGIDHFIERGSLDALEAFVRSSRTNWLTADERERFELTTFTPASLRRASR